MKNKAASKIEARLTAGNVPEPPAELLQTLKDEIPTQLEVVGETDRTDRTPAGRRPALRLLAASLFLAVVGGVVAYRVMERTGSALEETLWESPVQETKEQEPASEAATPAGPEAGREMRLEEATPEARELRQSVALDDARTSTLELEGPSDDPEPVKKATPKDLEKRKVDLDLAGEAALAPKDPRSLPDSSRASQDESAPAREREGVEGNRLQVAESAAPAPKLESALSDEKSRRSRPVPVEPRTPDPTFFGNRPDDLGVGAVAPPSTGGTDEPNDQPYGDMFFRSYGVNPFVDTEDDRFSTFGLDVDTGSYTLARSYLQRGYLPPSESVRVEEFLNYFDYGDRAPGRGDFGLAVEGAPSPFAEGPRYHLIRFGLAAREVDPLERRPAQLIFVVDVSGSMERENRLGLVRESLALLLGELEKEDRVGLVVYGSRGEVLLEPTGDHEAIRAAIGRLRPGGATNAEEGLALAYDLARRHYRPEAINRLILCSDGVANVGRTGAESILERISDEADRGIELTTVGFGMGNYNDVLMEQLADRGDGSYAYVDNLGEARRIFVENLTGILSTVARDAKVQVEFDPAVVSRYRLLGYENRAVADERFRDDTVDAGEIGAGHRVTALYEVKLAEDSPRRAPLATFRLRYHSTATGRVEELSREVRTRDLAPTWGKAPTSLRLAALVAEFAEILKGTYWARGGDLGDLFRRAQALSAELPGDAAVAELAALVGRAAAIRSR